jgi:hypothetical protein
MRVLREMGVYDYEEQITTLSEMYGYCYCRRTPDRAQTIKDQMDFLSKYGTLYNKLELNIFAGHDQREILKKRCDNISIDVAADLDSKYVSDTAVPADKKSYPIRWLIVAMSTAAAFVFAFIVLLITDSLKKLRAEGKSRRHAPAGYINESFVLAFGILHPAYCTFLVLRILLHHSPSGCFGRSLDGLF